jgi:porcupine-like protein
MNNIIKSFHSELIEWDTSIWHHLRGSALIISMKAISIAFDVSSKKLPTLPPVFEYFGYQLCPANLVLGPFVSFNSYKASSKGFNLPFKQLAQIFLNSTLSILFIFVSTCFLNYLISDNAR